ncbi:MAG: S-layer homology domain-containing protein [Acidimicrobiia bacterium]|nr:S-layer homology domain-containing protein [Acidimicrobiia bacterium]
MRRGIANAATKVATVAALLPILFGAAAGTAQEPPPTTSTTTTTVPPPVLPYTQQFESESWHEDWTDWRFADERNTSIRRGYRASGLRVNIPPNERRGTGPFWRMPDGVDEAWFRYRIRLDDFEPITSGKLPGLAGMPNFTARGCNPSTETYPGWSARMLFTSAGSNGLNPDQIRLGYYTYHLDQPGDCGEFMLWDDEGVIGQDHWYCIEGRVRLNTPGSADGVLEGWVDNAPAFSQDGLRFRRESEDWLEVRTFWLNVYFGGSTIPNDRNLTLRLDDLTISETGRIGCPDRFRDDDGNQHEPDIDWMFQQELIYGCGPEQYCPKEKLSRAETAALLERVIAPPATAVDHFRDDDGHWAEDALNRLAAVGVLRGCGDELACPDDQVTRGQFAALLTRALGIPPAGADFFVDDDGSLFESSINSIAAVGITRGCHNTTDRYCPTEAVLRDQAATLLARAVRWWQG